MPYCEEAPICVRRPGRQYLFTSILPIYSMQFIVVVIVSVLSSPIQGLLSIRDFNCNFNFKSFDFVKTWCCPLLLSIINKIMIVLYRLLAWHAAPAPAPSETACLLWLISHRSEISHCHVLYCLLLCLMRLMFITSRRLLDCCCSHFSHQKALYSGRWIAYSTPNWASPVLLQCAYRWSCPRRLNFVTGRRVL